MTEQVTPAIEADPLAPIRHFDFFREIADFEGGNPADYGV